MGRGQYSLFNNIFEKVEQEDKEIRPRNYFMPLRNQHLTYRYYYYANIRFLRFDKCLEILEQEFYITEARLVVLLNDDTDLLKKIAQEKPSVKELQKKIPHFNW